MSSMRKWGSPSSRISKGGLLSNSEISSYYPFDPFDMNITEYIKNSDIVTARNIGVWVKKIILPCNYGENPSRELYLNFCSWIENNDVLLHEEERVNKSQYGDRDYDRTYYFHKFKVYTNYDGGLTNFSFGELSSYEIDTLKKENLLKERLDYDSNKDLDMLRIAYGIARKYPKLLEIKGFRLECGIFGIVPNLIEPTSQQIFEYEQRLKNE